MNTAFKRNPKNNIVQFPNKAKGSSVAEIPSSRRAYEPRGAAIELMYSKEPELIMEGAAGTGKSRTCLEKLDICARKYDGMRAAIIRKTRVSIHQSAKVTYEEKVLPATWLGKVVKFRTVEQEYRYPNKSVIIVGGLDNPTKVMSTEFDLIYVQEAIELIEEEWEALSSRLRNGVMPYQQIIGDTNPDNEQHWIIRRSQRINSETGVPSLRLLHSVHEDNPAVTPEYLSRLNSLTGLRYKRLRLGLWISAEGQVYEEYDQHKHQIFRFTPSRAWKRIWAIDFGYTNPFVWQEWLIDKDNNMLLHREIYKTRRLVEEHAKDIKELTKNEPKPDAIICDHDAEGRATLEAHLGMQTTPAYKSIQDGIQAVQARLKINPRTNKPRLLFMRDATVERDSELEDKKLPCSTVEEFPSYVWNTRAGRIKGEIPVDEYNHGMDTMRYAVAYVDNLGKSSSEGIYF